MLGLADANANRGRASTAPPTDSEQQQPVRIADASTAGRSRFARLQISAPETAVGGVNAAAFFDSFYTPILKEMVARVVEQESPVRTDVLVSTEFASRSRLTGKA